MIEEEAFNVPLVWVVCIGIFSVLSAFFGAIQLCMEIYHKCMEKNTTPEQTLELCQNHRQEFQLFMQRYIQDQAGYTDVAHRLLDIEMVVKNLQINSTRADIEKNVTTALRPLTTTSDPTSTTFTVTRPNPFN